MGRWNVQLVGVGLAISTWFASYGLRPDCIVVRGVGCSMLRLPSEEFEFFHLEQLVGEIFDWSSVIYRGQHEKDKNRTVGLKHSFNRKII